MKLEITIKTFFFFFPTNWLFISDAGKDWRQEENEMTEDLMIGWHHWIKEHEFEQTPGDSEGQGSTVCAVFGVAKSQTWLSDWITIIKMSISILFIGWKKNQRKFHDLLPYFLLPPIGNRLYLWNTFLPCCHVSITFVLDSLERDLVILCPIWSLILKS